MKNENPADIDGLVESGLFHEALALVEALIGRSPEQAKFRADKGWMLFRMEDYLSALESFSEALSHRPKAATTLYFRAQCRERLGDMEGALNDYYASFEIEPRADALLNIGLLLR